MGVPVTLSPSVLVTVAVQGVKGSPVATIETGEQVTVVVVELGAIVKVVLPDAGAYVAVPA